MSIYKALLAVQAEMPTAIINKVNPHFRNRYADLGAVREAVFPILTRHGLVLTQNIREGGTLSNETVSLYTMITHVESGEQITSCYPLPRDAKPQELGLAITYGRRYSIVTLCGLVSEEDDDGEAAHGRGSPTSVTYDATHTAIKKGLDKKVVVGVNPWAESVAFTALKNSLEETKDAKAWLDTNKNAFANLSDSEKAILKAQYHDKTRTV